MFVDILYLLLFCLIVALMTCWLKAYRVLIGLTLFFVSILAVVWLATWPVDHDEVEHLHCIYLLTQNLLPYRDFWQNHPPLIWLVLLPLFKLVPATSAIVIFSRLFCVGLSVLLYKILWNITRAVWREKSRPMIFMVFFICAVIPSELFWIRPDVFSTIFVFLSIYFLILYAQTPIARYLFFAGLCMSLNVSFVPKIILVIPMGFVVSYWMREGSFKQFVQKGTIYTAGLIAGAAPLLSYLNWHKIWPEFYDQALKFNTLQKMNFSELSGNLNYFILIGGVVTFLLCLIVMRAKHVNVSQKTLALSTILIGYGCILHIPTGAAKYSYNLMPMFVGFCLWSPWVYSAIKSLKSRLSRVLILGLLGTALVLSPVHTSFIRMDDLGQKNTLRHSLERMQWMIDHSLGEYVYAVTPNHPIYALDMNSIYMRNQLTLFYDFHGYVDEYTQEDFKNRIRKYKPALLTHEKLSMELWYLKRYGVSPSRSEINKILADEGYIQLSSEDGFRCFVHGE